MRRSWIVIFIAAAVLLAAYAVTSSPLFNKPVRVGEGSELEYDLDYSDSQFTLLIVNPTEQPRKLEFMSSEHVRILVREGEGVVFNSSEGMMFTQQINYVEIEPGEQKAYRVSWTDAAKGTYQVEAYLLAISKEEPVATMDLAIE